MNERLDMALKKNETIALLKELERQGARLEGKRFKSTGGANPGSLWRYPVKVYPPDGSSMFAVHQTVGDVNQQRILTAQLRRAGFDVSSDALVSIGIGSRKEPPMPTTTDVEASTDAQTPLQHVQVPPGAVSRRHPPLQVRIDALDPVLGGLPDTFWTDQALEAARGFGLSGYAGTSGMTAMQSMLDFIGYRVVEAKRNRNGYSYRWMFDPNAKVEAGAVRGVVTPIAKEAAAPAVAPEAVAEQEQPTPEGFEVFERKSKHERRQCETCGQWYTVAGYERHIEDTRHGEAMPAVSTTAELHEEDLVTTGNGQPEAPKVELAYVAKVDFDAMEQMAQEAEAKAAELSTVASEAIERANTEHGERVRLQRELDHEGELAKQNEAELAQQAKAKNAALDELARAQQAREEAIELLSDARLEAMALREQVRQLQDQPPAVDDGSWLIDPEQVKYSNVQSLVEDATKLGVVVEIRGRRA